MTLAVSLWWLPIVTDDTEGWAIWQAGRRIGGPFVTEEIAAYVLRHMLEN